MIPVYLKFCQLAYIELRKIQIKTINTELKKRILKTFWMIGGPYISPS